MTLAVGDRVWNDLDNNGIQDASEPGIAGAVVEIFSSTDGVAGNADDVSRGAAITDANGNYALGGLADGVNYYLVFRAPVGYSFALQDRGSDDSLDSDANVSGLTAMFTLNPNQNRTDLDAGLIGAAPAFGLALRAGAAGDDRGASMAADSSGNMYVAGWFQGTADFDPGPGLYNLTSLGGDDIFVAKYSPGGALVWARAIGDTSRDEAYSIGVAADGSVYTTGLFAGTVDFDPGPGTYPLTVAAGDAAFVSKLDAAGNFLWAKMLGGGGDAHGYAIAVGADGSAVTAGYFAATATFGPFNLTSAGTSDAYVCKLNAAGTVLWANRLGGTGDDSAYRIALGPDGSAYAQGGYHGSVDLNPDPGLTQYMTSAGGWDVFVWKLDSQGDAVWTRSMGGTGDDFSGGIAVGSDGSVHTSGDFIGTADFDPLSATFNLVSAGGSYDAFVSKLDSAGSFVWAKALGGTGVDWGNNIAVAADGSVYTTGGFNLTGDFDPGPAAFNLTSAGSADVFVSKLDSAGNFAWARRMGGNGTNGDNGFGIAVGTDGTVYTAGVFTSTVDFDSGPGTFNLTSAGGNDIFVSKMSQLSLGDRVWSDSDGDGVQDAGEPGVAGAAVELFGSQNSTVGDSDDYSLGTTTTDANGQYRFDGLVDGVNYYLVFRTPVGYAFTLQDQGSDDTLDSDANATGVTAMFTLTAGQNRTDLDAGLCGASPAFGFAAPAGSGGDDRGYAITRDASGNLYATGRFRGTADFDPGPGTYSLTSAGSDDIFVAKYTPAGALAWARRMGGTTSYEERGYAVAVGADGSVYATGKFGGTATFGAVSLTAAGWVDVFVTKLDSDGNVAWARRMGGPIDDAGVGITVGPDGSVYATGCFDGTASFGAANLTSAGWVDVFVVKLDSAGNVAWARRMGGTSDDTGNDVVVGTDGNVYTTGYFNGTASFGSTNLTSAGSHDLFVSKLDSAGNVVWARSMGGISDEYANGIAADTDGSVYAAGIFYGTAAFGGSSVTSAGGADAFVAKLDSAGNVQWARRMGGTSDDSGADIAVASDGNVYATGSFQGTAGFGTTNLTSAGSADAFVAKLDLEGNVAWARRMGGVGDDGGNSVAVSPAGRVYSTGWFSATSDFDPGPGAFNLTSTGSSDIFVGSFSQLSLGDRVWDDRDGDGVQDAGEPGAAGVAVELFNSQNAVVNDSDDFSLGTTTTDANGEYRFDGLVDGVNYYLVFRAPVGYAFTLQDSGGDDTLDSDADASGVTAMFTLTAGQDRTDVAAGLIGGPPDFGFAIGAGGGSDDSAQSIARDAAGNVYMIGSFQGTADFDPGPRTANLVSAGSNDVFVAKYSPGGALVWAKRFGGSGDDQGHSIAVGSDGRIYITGWFSGTAGFGPANLTSAGSYDGFVARLDTAGNVDWARGFGGSGDDEGYAVAVGSDGAIYATGYFSNTASFGALNRTSAGGNDAFVARFDSGGNVAWAARMGGPSNDIGAGIVVANDGNIFTTGYFQGTAGFGTTNLTSAGSSDVFVSKLDASGNFGWATRMGGTGDDYGNGVVASPGGSVHITGFFQGTAGFGTTNLTSAGSADAFVARLDAGGNVGWARRMGGTGFDAGYGIALGPDGYLYACGYFQGTAGFGAINLTSAGSWDVFAARLDAGGNFAWARRMGGTSNDYGYGIVVGPDGSAYATGYFAGTADFNPGSGTFNLTSAGGYDLFLAEIPPNRAPVLDGAGDMRVSAIDEDDTNNSGTLVSEMIASAGGDRITDADADAVEGIAVIAADTASGQWQFSLDNGGTWDPMGTVLPSAARLLASDANTRLRFVPAANFNGALDPAITFRAWDQTEWTNGGTADASTGGGSTAFSTVTETASITVNPMPETPAFSSLAAPTIVYGTAFAALSGTIVAGPFVPTGSVSIVLNGVTHSASINQTTGAFSYNFDTGSLHVSGSPYTITYSYAGDAEFNSITDTAHTATVTPASLTVTADGKSKSYGQVNPAFTAGYSGFVGTDGPGNLSGTLTLSTTAGQFSHAGNYPITPSGLSSSDYTLAFQDGTLTVNPAALTVTADNKTKTYGQLSPVFTASFNGFVGTDGPGNLSGTLTLSTTAGQFSHAGNYPITPSGLSSSDYTITFQGGTLTVNPAALTVTADNKTKTYGQLNPAFTASYSGFVGTDGPGNLSGPLVLSTAAGQFSHVGSYPITPSGLSSSDYTITFQTGTLTVNAAALTVTADNKTKTYGQLNPAFTASYGGFVGTDGPGNLSGPLVLSTTAGQFSHVGSYLITPSGLSSSDYTITFQNGTLTVNPAALTITADDRTKDYGEAVTFAGIEFTSSGLVSSDTVMSVSLVSDGAAAEAPAGKYDIVPNAAAGSGLTNYDIAYANGTLTVDPVVYIPDQPGNNKLTLHRSGDNLELVLVRAGKKPQVVWHGDIAAVEKLTVYGARKHTNAMTVESVGIIPQRGLVFDSVNGIPTDSLVVHGTTGADWFEVGSTFLLANSRPIPLRGVEHVTLDGGAGDDIYDLSGLIAKATLVDSGGRDRLNFAGATAAVTIDLSKSTGQAQRVFGTTSTNTLGLKGTFEDVDGTAQDDRIKGNAAANEIHGNPGNDTLYGGAGDDLLDGGGGDDWLYGDAGNDTLYGGSGNNVLLGGGGDDVLDTDAGVVAGLEGRNLLVGGAGIDTLRGGLGEEVLIGGTTSYDAKVKKLEAVMREWTSTRSFQERCDKLETGFQDPIAGLIRLKRREKTFPQGTVLDDAAADALFGGPGSDWFLASSSDDVRDFGPGDRRP